MTGDEAFAILNGKTGKALLEARAAKGLAADTFALVSPFVRPSLDSYGAGNPLYIAHRGSGLVYPEYSMASYHAAYTDGLRALEADVWSLSDGGLGVMHNSTVDATTTGTGTVTAFATAAFRALSIDANTWHGSNFGNALTPPLLPEFLAAFKGKVIFCIEAKGGTANASRIITALQNADIASDQVFLNSFTISDLTAFKAAGYTNVSYNAVGVNPATARASALAAGIGNIAFNVTDGDAAIQDTVTAGFNVTVAGVFRRVDRDHHLAMGVTQFYADDAQYLGSSMPLATRDNFAAQTWMPGMMSGEADYGLNAAARGRFFAPDYWGFSGIENAFVLQGWAGPIKGDVEAKDFTIEFGVKYGTTADQTRWPAIFLASSAMADRKFLGTGGVDENGVNILLRKNGSLQIYTVEAGVSTSRATTALAAIADDQEVFYRVVVTSAAVTIHRLDGDGGASIGNATYAMAHKGGYFHFGHNGAPAYFRRVRVS